MHLNTMIRTAIFFLCIDFSPCQNHESLGPMDSCKYMDIHLKSKINGSGNAEKKAILYHF